MQRIADVTPVPGVPLVARHLLADAPVTTEQLMHDVVGSLAMLAQRQVPRPRRATEDVVTEALDRLHSRHLIARDGDHWRVTKLGGPVLTYYANSIAHHFDITVDTAPISAPQQT